MKADILGGASVIMAITSLSILTYYSSSGQTNHSPEIKVEYQIEIIDQNTVKVRSIDNGKIYVVPFDKVENALIKDNL